MGFFCLQYKGQSAIINVRTQFYILCESILIGHKCTLFALHKNLSYKIFFEIECRNLSELSHFASAVSFRERHFFVL